MFYGNNIIWFNVNRISSPGHYLDIICNTTPHRIIARSYQGHHLVKGWHLYFNNDFHYKLTAYYSTIVSST